MSDPSVRASPGSTSSPLPTSSRVRRGKLYSLGSGSSPLASSAVGVTRDLDRPLRVLDVDLSGDLGERSRALRVARLEDLDDAREAVRDVGSCDTARVEGAHGQLRARLADRLGGDDAHRVADLGHAAGREEGAVAEAAEAPLAAALQHRANRDRRRVGVLTELLDETTQAAHG